MKFSLRVSKNRNCIVLVKMWANSDAQLIPIFRLGIVKYTIRSQKLCWWVLLLQITASCARLACRTDQRDTHHKRVGGDIYRQRFCEQVIRYIQRCSPTQELEHNTQNIAGLLHEKCHKIVVFGWNTRVMKQRG